MYGIRSIACKGHYHHLEGGFHSFKQASDALKEITKPDMLYKQNEVKIYCYYDKKEEKMWNLVLDLIIKGEDVATIVTQLEDVVKKIKAGQLAHSNYVEGETKQTFEVEYEIRKAK